MSSQDMALLLCPVMSSRGDTISASFLIQTYLQFPVLIFEIIRFLFDFMYLMSLFLVC